MKSHAQKKALITERKIKNKNIQIVVLKNCFKICSKMHIVLSWYDSKSKIAFLSDQNIKKNSVYTLQNSYVYTMQA